MNHIRESGTTIQFVTLRRLPLVSLRKAHILLASAQRLRMVGSTERSPRSFAVSVSIVNQTDSATLHGFVVDRAGIEVQVYTDEARAYNDLPRDREVAKHSVTEFVNGKAHINGIERFWAMLTRGYHVT